MKLIQKMSVLFLVFCFLAVPVGAAAVQSSADDFDAIALLTAAGLIEKEDAEQDRNAYVSRAELAVMAARFRGIEPMAQAYYEKPVFYDVERDYYEAGYIHAAVLAGLILPAEPGYFRPTEAVDCLTAIKSLMTVLGYRSEAVKRGDTVTAWMSVAATAGLTGSKSFSSSAKITRGELYDLVENSLDVDVLVEEVVTEDMVQMSASKGQGLLEVYHDIYEITGIVEDNGRSALDTADSTVGSFEWLISGGRYRAERVASQNLLGYRVRAYYHENEGEKSLIYAAPYRNEVVHVEAEDILSYQSRVYRYTDSETDREETIDTSRAFIMYNGASAEGMFFEPIPEMGGITAVDNDGDGDYEVVRIEAYKDYLATGVDVDAEVIYVQNDTAIRLDEYKQYFIKQAQGNKSAALGNVAKGSVLSVMADLHGKNITILISSQTVSGSVTEVEENGKYTQYLVGETWYKSSLLYDRRVKAGLASKLSAGSSAMLYLNAFGQIADATQKSDLLNSYQFGVVLAAETGAFEDDVKLQIFSELGLMEIFPVADRPYVDEKRAADAGELLKALYQSGEEGVRENALVPQVIRFKTDELGTLTHLDRYGSEPTADKSLYMVKDSLDAEFGMGYSITSQSLRLNGYMDTLGLGGTEAVFTVPVENGKIIKGSSDLYSRDSIGIFSNGEKFKFQTYKTDPDILSQEILVVPVAVVDGKAVRRIPEEAPVNVFLRSVQGIDDAGNVRTKIYYSEDGSEKTGFLADDIDIKAIVQSDGSRYSLQPGDVFRVNADTAGNIDSIEVAYSRAQDLFLPTAYTSSSTDVTRKKMWNPNEVMYLTQFHLDTYDGRYMRASFTDPAEVDFNDPQQFYLTLLSQLGLANILVYDAEHESVRRATEGDLREWRTSGADYARGLLWKRYTVPRKLILYQ